MLNTWPKQRVRLLDPRNRALGRGASLSASAATNVSTLYALSLPSERSCERVRYMTLNLLIPNNLPCRADHRTPAFRIFDQPYMLRYVDQ